MRNSACVTTGNKYIYERAVISGTKKIKIIPTSVDIEKYKNTVKKRSNKIIIGWIGTPSTALYLKDLKHVFRELTKNCEVKIIAIGAQKKNLKNMPVDHQPWTEETETEYIKQFDIGIMPLPDSYWEKGKCGYKLIQYMACKIPVIASPVGINQDIVEHGVNGFLATNIKEWIYYSNILVGDKDLRERMGEKGRKKIESWYCYQVQNKIVTDIIEKSK